MKSSPPTNDDRRQLLLGGVLIILLTVLAYLPALSAGFVWDDDSMVTNNAVVQSPGGLKDIWFSTKLPDYYPLTWTSLWLEWRWWGMKAAGYHITNVLLHALSAALWWRILKSLKIPGAWLAAAIFAVHPVNVESVAWIAERKNVLAMFFYALALWAYQRFENKGEKSQSKKSLKIDWRWYFIALAAFALALLSKTAVVGLPIVLLLCAWWRRGKVTRRDLLRSAPFFGLALLLGLATVWFQYHSAHAGEVVATRSMGARTAGAGMAVWFYLWKAVWPANLMFVYPQWEINARSILVYLPVAALAICFAVFWRWRKGWGKPALFGLGYFVVMLFPVLGFLKIYFQLYSLVTDHWQYFSIMGVIAFAVGVASWWLVQQGKKLIGQFLGTLVLGLLCVLTWRQAALYENKEVLWRDTLAKNPACWMANNDLGFYFKQTGRFAEAEAQFRAAVKLKPDFVLALNNLGLVLEESGKTDEAIRYYTQAISLQPKYAEAHNNLGVALAKQGKMDEAIAHFREASRIDPTSVEAQGNLDIALGGRSQNDKASPNDAQAQHQLGMVLAEEGKLLKAVEHYEAALRVKPDFVEAHNSLGGAFVNLGRLDEAIAQFHLSLKLKPNQARAHDNLGIAFAMSGRLDEAITQLRAALRFEPDNANTHFNLANVFVLQRQFGEAIKEYHETLRLQPNHATARQKLELLDASAPK